MQVAHRILNDVFVDSFPLRIAVLCKPILVLEWNKKKEKKNENKLKLWGVSWKWKARGLSLTNSKGGYATWRDKVRLPSPFGITLNVAVGKLL